MKEFLLQVGIGTVVAVTITLALHLPSFCAFFIGFITSLLIGIIIKK